MPPETCLCGRSRAKRPGDPMEVGDIVGGSIEPGMRYGRIVGFVKSHVRLDKLGAARVIIREFRAGDGRWPTGGHVRAWLVIPWDHDHPCTELGRRQETIDWNSTADVFALPRRAS